jgi:mono/diheme cytochrome c family protein
MSVTKFMMAAGALALATSFGLSAQTQSTRPKGDPDAPTFAKDVAPILYKNCVGCHGPGEIAPMSLLTYDEARPWAKAIRDEVSEGNMPPWHAAPSLVKLRDERRLTDTDRQTLIRWANTGAAEGDPKTAPTVPTFSDGWRMGKPDAVFEMTEDYPVPAEGTIEYEWFYIPTNFSEPKYVQSIEVRPGNKGVVHHVLVYYRANPDKQRAPVLQPNAAQMKIAERAPGSRPPKGRELGQRRLIASFAPGTDPQTFPAGTALRLEAGGTIELQMHYTTNGTAGTDRSKVGVIYAKAEPRHEIRATAFYNGGLVLPPGAEDVKVDADLTFVQDAILWGMLPHTHLRGKKWEYRLELPDGTSKMILAVPKYDFNWQTYYMFDEPLLVPKGAKLVSSAWYDNSAKNKFNPDPKVQVLWGDQTWEEMQYTGLLFSPATTAPTTSASK